MKTLNLIKALFVVVALSVASSLFAQSGTLLSQWTAGSSGGKFLFGADASDNYLTNIPNLDFEFVLYKQVSGNWVREGSVWFRFEFSGYIDVEWGGDLTVENAYPNEAPETAWFTGEVTLGEGEYRLYLETSVDPGDIHYGAGGAFSYNSNGANGYGGGDGYSS